MVNVHIWSWYSQLHKEVMHLPKPILGWRRPKQQRRGIACKVGSWFGYNLSFCTVPFWPLDLFHPPWSQVDPILVPPAEIDPRRQGYCKKLFGLNKCECPVDKGLREDERITHINKRSRSEDWDWPVTEWTLRLASPPATCFPLACQNIFST